MTISNVKEINSISSFEQLCIFFVVPIIFLLLIMKYTFLLTIKFHNHKGFVKRTKIIVLQFLLWFLSQFFLYLLPIKELVININFFDVNTLSILSLISFFHFVFCFTFLSTNNKNIKIIRFTILVTIVVSIILQFNFTMLKLSLPSFKNVYSLLGFLFFYYCLLCCFWKMFNKNLLTIFNLFKTTWKTLLKKSVLPNILDKQLPVKLYTKTKIIMLLWQFEHQTYAHINKQTSFDKSNNIKLLTITYKKNLVYFLNSQIVLTAGKTIQDLKTLINGWKIRQIQ